MVELQVLGTVGVRSHGGFAPIRSSQQRLILAHLCLAKGDPVGEQVLVDELWETPPADPLHALQAHMSRLRRSTGLLIEHAPGGYRLNHDDVEVDAARFEDLLRSAKQTNQDPELVVTRLEEGTALWRGPVLEDLPPRSRLHSDRARLELLYEDAVTELADAYLALERPEAALPLLQESVNQNPVNERRWGQLMMALDRAGQRGDALEAFSRARERLVDLLGLEPNAELQQIQRDILAEDRPATHPSTLPDILPTPADLFGREGEWAKLTRLWREARHRQRIVLLTGEPGIGKTYLASRFTAALGGATVHSSRCHAARGVPYEPLAQLIRSDCADLDPPQIRSRLGSGATALRDVLPDLVGASESSEEIPSGPLDPQVEHHRIKLALGDWLHNAAESAPLCLMIDDLQWADSESLRLLTELWSQPEQLPILWVITLRDREELPDSPRASLLDQAIRPSEEIVHLGLAGLARPAIAELMEATMDAAGKQAVSTEAVDNVLAATGGNPLFVLETARHFDDRGGVDQRLVPAQLPPSLAALVDDHVARLDPPDRDLLDVAAIIGEEFDPLVVGIAADRQPTALDGFLASAQRLRLIEPASTAGLRHRFRHALLQTVVLQKIPPVRRAHLHLRVARAVEDLPYAPDRLHVLAHHYTHAVSLVGGGEAVRHVLAAAAASQRQRAPAVALDLYRTAHRLLSAESPAEQRCEVLLGLGEAGFRAGTDYRDDLLAAARLASEIGDVDRLVRAAIANNRGWYSNLAEIDHDRVSVIEAALAMLTEDAKPVDQPARSRLLSLWAMENVRDPARREEALSSSDESLRIAEGLGERELVGEVMCHRFSILYATTADPAGTFEFAQRLDDFAHTRLDPELQLKSAIAVAQSAMTTADFATADRALNRSQQLATELAHPPRLWLVNTWIATRTATRGDVDAAQVQAADALALGTSLEEPDAFTWFAGQLFVFHHMAERLPALIDTVEEQVAELTDQIPAWRAAYALTLTTVERWNEARVVIDELCSANFEQLPLDVLYLPGLSYLTDATARLGYAEPATQLYNALLPYEGMVATNAVIDAGPVDLRLGQAAWLRGDLDSARRHLAAAERFCRGNNTHSWLEHVVKAQASML
ncbi:MAG: AAA family ATPase [Nocardioidaceae bacterium]|nr:AAA family ATPase [Nocardioidaceae bacterium]